MAVGNPQATRGTLDAEWTTNPPIGRERGRNGLIPVQPRHSTRRSTRHMAPRSDEGVGRVASALLSIESRFAPDPQPGEVAEVAGEPPQSAPVRPPLAEWRPPQGAERRDFPRHPSGCRVAVCQVDDSTALTAQQRNWRLHATPIRGELADISLTGAALWLEHELAAGEELYIRLSHPGTTRTLDVPARVLRAEPMRIGAGGDVAAVRIVCVFRRRLAVHELREFSHSRLPAGVV